MATATPLDAMVQALGGGVSTPTPGMLNTPAPTAIQQATQQSPLNPQMLAQMQANQPGVQQAGMEPSPAQQMLQAQMANSVGQPGSMPMGMNNQAGTNTGMPVPQVPTTGQ